MVSGVGFAQPWPAAVCPSLRRTPPFKALFFFLLESADTAVLYCCTVYGFAVFYPNSSSTVLRSSKEVAAAVLHGVVVLK